MRPDADRLRPVLWFFALTFALTAPFWAISAASGLQLLPGLPIAAFAVVCPAAAALAITWRSRGLAAGRALLARVFDAGRLRSRLWWLPILFISPAIAAVMFVALRLSGSGVPDPHIAPLGAVALFAVFLPGALCEELGWSGFALGPVQARWGATAAGLLIGAVWAVWHYLALLEAHRSASWIAWWSLGTVAQRVIMVWLFNNTGASVFGVALFHAMSNLCWQLFPVQGSWFDPRLNGVITAAVALAVVLGTRAFARSGDRDINAPARANTRASKAGSS